MRLLVLLLFFPFAVPAQLVLRGSVLDSFTRKGVPYATIGLARQNTGTNADELGRFAIPSARNDDSLLVSCIGYETLKLPLAYFEKQESVLLVPKPRILRTVTVKNRWTVTELNPFRKCHSYSLTSSGYQSQVAQHLEAPVANAWLQGVRICLGQGKGQCTFRLRVYDLDSLTQGPGDELTDSMVQVRAGKGVVSVDLEPYNIQLPGKEFFIAIEWLFIPANEYHFTTLYEGKKTAMMHYWPYISFGEASPSQASVWSLSYSQTWHPMRMNGRDMQIAATVKY